MTFPTTIGVESLLTEQLPDLGIVRATLRLLPPFPPGQWLKVSVSARVYDFESVTRTGAVPSVPRAQGPEVTLNARLEASVVDLELPPMHLNQWAVVAKVLSVDERYPANFEPSRCYVGAVRFGHVARMKVADLEAIYTGATNNPIAEAEVRRLVGNGVIVAEGEDGRLYRAREEDRRLRFDPLH